MMNSCYRHKVPLTSSIYTYYVYILYYTSLLIGLVHFIRICSIRKIASNIQPQYSWGIISKTPELCLNNSAALMNLTQQSTQYPPEYPYPFHRSTFPTNFSSQLILPDPTLLPSLTVDHHPSFRH